MRCLVSKGLGWGCKGKPEIFSYQVDRDLVLITASPNPANPKACSECLCLFCLKSTFLWFWQIKPS